MADNLQGDLLSPAGQGDAFIALVGEKLHLIELFGHARDGCRRNIHLLGDGIRRHGGGFLLKLVNILQVIFHLFAEIA